MRIIAKKWLSILLAICLLMAVLISAVAEGLEIAPAEDVSSDFVDALFAEQSVDLDEADVEEQDMLAEAVETTFEEESVMLEGDDEPTAGYEPEFFEVTVDPTAKSPTITMKTGDCARVRLLDASAMSWKVEKDEYALIAKGADQESEFVDITASKEVKKAKVIVTLESGKKFTLYLVIKDPYIPESIAFKAEMPTQLRVGETLDLASMVALTPSYARGLSYKVSGAASVNKDTGVLTAEKSGKVTIQVRAAKDSSVKTEKIKLNVVANEARNLSPEPSAKLGDFDAIQGGWTIWPLSVAVNKKGGLDAQIRVLNATGEKSKRIEGLFLTLYSDTNVPLAVKDFGDVKVSVGNNKAKTIKLTFDPGDCFTLSGVDLAGCAANGTLTFRVDETAVMSSKKNVYPFIPSDYQREVGVKTLVIKDGVVTGYNGDGGEVVIPALTEDNETITAIGPGAFKGNDKITSVYIDYTVTEIGDSAFEDCANLTEVTIANGNAYVGMAAFKNCGKLKTMKIIADPKD